MSKASFNEAMTRAGFDDQTTRISKENLKKCLTELANAIWFDTPVILIGSSGFIAKTTIEMRR